jgi:pimeloyl-ACP methyl ester carboxylesterase
VLPRVRAPALVLRGARDAACPARWAREVAALLPDAELRTIPGAAHAVHWTAPARVAAEIEACGERVVGGG